MSRIIISNNKSTFSRSLLKIQESGLEKSYENILDLYFIANFKKRIHSFGNFYEKNENEFVVVSGTMIYKNKVGTEALAHLFSDFDGDVNRFKKECIGLFLLVICKSSKTYIFNDYYGIYDSNYYRDSNEFFISNSLADIVIATKKHEIDNFGLILESFHLGCFNEKTPFMNISKLKGDQYILINNSEFKIEKIQNEEYRYNYNNITEDEALIKLKELLITSAKNILSCFGNIAINMTGGLDSRTVLTTFKEAGANPSILYGIGDGFITPTCVEDKKVVKLISKRINAPLYFMNWNDCESENGMSFEHQKSAFNKYGFLNLVYSANKNIFAEYEGKIKRYPEFMEFGYFLENLRLREWAEKLDSNTFSLDEFVDEYYINKNLYASYSQYSDFKDYITNTFKDILSLYKKDIDFNKISIDYFERLRWNTARYSDSRMHIFVNEFTHTFPLFGIPEIHELILSLPANIIKKGKFQVKLINLLNSEMLKFPLFSHMRSFKINRDFSKSKIITIKNIADDVIDVCKFMEKPMKKIYRKLFYKNFKFIENKIYKEINEFNNIPIRIENYAETSSLYNLYKYRQFLIGYNYILQCNLEKGENS